jgi:radical SAM superfamily enzyme YgiQ (UPF0313 family)
VAKSVKDKNPNILVVRGGPHQPYFTEESYKEFPFIDYSCSTHATGEYFFKEFLPQIQEHKKVVTPEIIPGLIMRGYTAIVGKQVYDFPKFSTYEHNIAYLTNVAGTAKRLNKTAVGFAETTRGCPYECTYCEWGGGIGTKVSQKPTEVVIKDLDILSLLGFGNIDFVDANFGILKRDPELMQRVADNKELYGFPHKVLVYGVAKVKIEKREAFLDVAFKNDLMDYYSMSVQSISQTALDNVKRTDVAIEDNLALGKKFYEKYGKYAKLEIILGLPGYTLTDFYNEMNLTNKIGGVWDWSRGPLTILPGTELSEPFYRALHKIKTANIGVTENDDNDVKVMSKCVLGNYRSPQEVVVECYSFSREEWKEMFFMNYAQRAIGPTLHEEADAAVEMKTFYDSIQNEDWFICVMSEIDKLSKGQRSDKDFLLYDGHLIEDWVNKFYLNKEKFNGSYN